MPRSLKIVSRPDVKKAWGNQGAVTMTMTIPEFRQYLIGDIAKWARVVKSAGIRVN